MLGSRHDEPETTRYRDATAWRVGGDMDYTSNDLGTAHDTGGGGDLVTNDELWWRVGCLAADWSSSKRAADDHRICPPEGMWSTRIRHVMKTGCYRIAKSAVPSPISILSLAPPPSPRIGSFLPALAT